MDGINLPSKAAIDPSADLPVQLLHCLIRLKGSDRRKHVCLCSGCAAGICRWI